MIRHIFFFLAEQTNKQNYISVGVTSPLVSLTILNMLNFSSYAYSKSYILSIDVVTEGFQPKIFLAGFESSTRKYTDVLLC